MVEKREGYTYIERRSSVDPSAAEPWFPTPAPPKSASWWTFDWDTCKLIPVESPRPWWIEQLLSGQALQLSVPLRTRSSMADSSAWLTPLPAEGVVSIKIVAHYDTDTVVLSYVYNGEYVELSVDRQELLLASTADLLVWADQAFIA